MIALSHFQRASAYPDDCAPARPSTATTSSAAGAARFSVQTAPTFAGPLYDEEGILYAELEGARLLEERQRFDGQDHAHRLDVLRFELTPLDGAGDELSGTQSRVTTSQKASPAQRP